AHRAERGRQQGEQGQPRQTSSHAHPILPMPTPGRTGVESTTTEEARVPLDSTGIHAGSPQAGRPELTSGTLARATVAHPRMRQKLNPRRKNVKNSLLDGGSSEFWMGIGGVSGRCFRAEERGPRDRARDRAKEKGQR